MPCRWNDVVRELNIAWMESWRTSDEERTSTGWLFEAALHGVVRDVYLVLFQEASLIHYAEESDALSYRNPSLVFKKPKFPQYHRLNDRAEETVFAIVNSHSLGLSKQPMKLNALSHVLLLQEYSHIICIGSDLSESGKLNILHLEEPAVVEAHILQNLDHLAIEDEGNWLGRGVADLEICCVVAFKFLHGRSDAHN